MNKWWLGLRLRMSGLQQQVIPADEYFADANRRKAKIENKRQKAMAREMRELLEGEERLLAFFKNRQPIIFDVRPHLGWPAIVVYDPRDAAKYKSDSVVRQMKTRPAFQSRLQQQGHFRFLYQDGKLSTINHHTPAFSIVIDEPVLVYNPQWLFHPTTQQQLRAAFAS